MNASRSVGDVKCQSSHLQRCVPVPEISLVLFFVFIGFLTFGDFSMFIKGPPAKQKETRAHVICNTVNNYSTQPRLIAVAAAAAV